MSNGVSMPGHKFTQLPNQVVSWLVLMTHRHRNSQVVLNLMRQRVCTSVKQLPLHWAMQQPGWLGCKVDYWNNLSKGIKKRVIFKPRSVSWSCLQCSPQTSCLGTAGGSAACSTWGEWRGGNREEQCFSTRFITGRDVCSALTPLISPPLTVNLGRFPKQRSTTSTSHGFPLWMRSIWEGRERKVTWATAFLLFSAVAKPLRGLQRGRDAAAHSSWTQTIGEPGFLHWWYWRKPKGAWTRP